jgi:hypothetical protein
MLACTMATAVQVRGRAWQSAPTARKPTADAHIMLASHLYLLYTFIIFVFSQVSARACGAPAPTPTTSLLTPVYQHASVAAAVPCTFLHRRACGAHCPFPFLFLFSLCLSLTSECARLRRACPPPSFHSHPC